MSRANTFISLLEMALTRNQFKTKIEEKLIGALREEAFILLAKKNNQTEWVQHKETEVERLKLELTDIFDFYEINGNWDKNKAAKETIDYHESRLKSYIVKAENQYSKYYGVEPKKLISENDLLLLLEEIRESLPKK